MASIDEYNVVVGGVSLNSAWRKTTTQIVIVRDSTGTSKMAAIEFVVEADNEADLAARWRATEQEFNTKNVAAHGYRINAANKIFDWGTDDGETISISSNVSMKADEAQTTLAYYGYLEIVADMNLEQGGGGGGVVPPIGGDIDGLLGPIVIAEIRDGGGNITRSAGGSFSALIEGAAIGPVAIVSIVSDDGAAKINFGEVVSGIASAPYAQVTGTINYNGQWQITEVGLDGGTGFTYIVISAVFVASETAGSVLIGEATSAEDLFDEARASILGILGAGEDNLTVVHQHTQNAEDGTFEFTITVQEQDFVPGGIGDGDTNLVKEVRMVTGLPELTGMWEADSDLEDIGASSAAPSTVNIIGEVVLNRPAITGSLQSHWDAIKADIIARAEAGIDGEDLTLKSTDVSFNHATPSISFSLSFINGFTDAIMLERTTSFSLEREVFPYQVGDGLHGLQFPNEEPVKVIQIEITRVGVGEVDLQRSDPTETGYYFHHHLEKGSSRGPLGDGALANVFVQSRIDTYFRFKLEATP
jgi:hypothetical protein